MKKLMTILLAVLMVVGTFTVCIGEEASISGEIEVAAFSNGDLYDHFWQTAKEVFEREYPDCKVNLVTSSEIQEIMRPRFVSGDAPDVYFMGGGANVDEAAFTAEGLFMDLTDWYETATTFDREGTIKENMGAEMFNIADGKIYGMAVGYGVWGYYYNTAMTEEYGWKAPTNWAEFEAVSKEIMDADNGIVPFVQQGVYPDYVGYGFMQGGIAADGGKQLLVDIGNLNPEAYDDPAVVGAWAKLEEVYKNGWCPEYCLSMNHTEAQLLWLQGAAFMIPCGNWLEGEMADNVPENFGFGFMPSFWHDGDHQVMVGNGARVSITANSKNPEAAKAFLSVLFSKEMAELVVSDFGSIPVMKGETEAQLSPSSQATLDIVNAGGVEVICEVGGAGNFEPYGELRDSIKNNIAAVLGGQIDGETARKNVQADIAAIAADDSIAKITISVA